MVTADSVGGGQPGRRPSSDEGPRRVPARDWRDSLRDAADLALLGILLCVAAAGVLTAAAAVATASAAVHTWLVTGGWPSAREIVGRFARAVLPGVPVSLVALAVAALLTANGAWLARGVVPGGAVALALTVALAGAAAGYAALVVVHVGRAGGTGWRAAARAAAGAVARRPLAGLAAAGVLVVAATVAVLVNPITVPILAGYVLATVHVAVRRAERAEAFGAR